MKKWMKYGAAAVMAAGMVLGGSMEALAAHLEDITARGTIRVGTTGDYRPMSYKDKETGKYEGFDAELAERLADSLHVKVEYVPDRERVMSMSDGYLLFGKTILCRKGDAGKYKSIADINRPEVKVMVNPGGTNEKFAKAYLPKATLIIHEQNAEIPGLIAEGKADIMITETMEEKKYAKMDSRLADPPVNQPFTKNRFGALMQKGDQEFLNYVNFFLAELETNGTMKNMEQKYIG